MSRQPLGVGILGSGNMAMVYADALATQVDGARLVMVALGSRAPGLADEHGVAAAADAAALLARPDVDIVVIATPHSTHRALALAAAAAGKHVYLEKPMALDVAECDAIIDACATAGVRLTVAKQTRHMQMSMRARELIDAGHIGEVRVVRATSPASGFELPPGHWLNDPQEGDLFLDWGSHACDSFRWFTGSEPERIYADYADFGDTGYRWPTGLVQVRMTNGAICQAFMAYQVAEPGLGSGSNTQYQIIGAEGTIEWDLDQIRVARDGHWRTEWQLETWLTPWQPRHARRIGNTARQVQGFVDAIRTGGETPVSGRDGRTAIAMAGAASRSAQTHEVVVMAAPERS